MNSRLTELRNTYRNRRNMGRDTYGRARFDEAVDIALADITNDCEWFDSDGELERAEAHCAAQRIALERLRVTDIDTVADRVITALISNRVRTVCDANDLEDCGVNISDECLRAAARKLVAGGALEPVVIGGIARQMWSVRYAA